MFSVRQRRNGRRTRSKRLLHSATGVADPQQRPAGQTDRDKQRARAAVQQRASLARRREQQGGGRVLRPEWAGSRRARMGLVPARNTSPRHGRGTGTECYQPRQPSVGWNDSGHNRAGVADAGYKETARACGAPRTGLGLSSRESLKTRVVVDRPDGQLDRSTLRRGTGEAGLPPRFLRRPRMRNPDLPVDPSIEDVNFARPMFTGIPAGS